MIKIQNDLVAAILVSLISTLELKSPFLFTADITTFFFFSFWAPKFKMLILSLK